MHSKMHLFILVHRFVFEGCHTFDEHRTVKKVQALRMLHNNNYLRYVFCRRKEECINECILIEQRASRKSPPGSPGL